VRVGGERGGLPQLGDDQTDFECGLALSRSGLVDQPAGEAVRTVAEQLGCLQ